MNIQTITPKIVLTQQNTLVPLRNAKSKLIAHLTKAQAGIDFDLTLFVKGAVCLGLESETATLEDWAEISYHGGILEILDTDTGWQELNLETSINLKTFYAVGIV